MVGGDDNGRQKTEITGYVIVGGELFTDYSDHPRKRAPSSRSNQRAPDATSFLSIGGMPTASSLAWKTSLRKVGPDSITQQIKERGALLWFSGGDIRQSAIQQYLGAPLPGAGCGQFERKADNLIAH